MAYGVPFQSPPSPQSMAAVLKRLSARGQKVPGMATGGQKPAAPVYTAPQNPSVATPYTGNIDTYGEGPEHDFFVNVAPPAPSSSGGGGNQDGGGGDGSGGGGNFTGSGGGQGNGGPASGVPGGAGPSTNAAWINNLAQSLNVSPQMAEGFASGPNMQSQLQRMFPAPSPPTFQQQVASGVKNPLAATQKAAAPAPNLGADLAPGGAGLSAYLKSLQGYQKGNTPGNQRWARGGPVGLAAGGQPPDPSAVVATPLQNVQNIQGNREGRQSDQSGGLSARDQANADVAVNPSVKSAIGIGSMIAGLAGGPMLGIASAAAKLGANALFGSGTSPFDVPGPRVSPEQQQAAIDASNSATGPLTNQRNAYNTSISGARSLDRQVANQQNNTPLGGYGQTVDNSITANFSSPAFSHGFQAGVAAAGGGGGGGDVGAAADTGGGGIGSGRGLGGGGQGDNAGFRKGGGARNYAKGGMPRFPSIKRFDQGGDTSDADKKAQAEAQAAQQAAAPNTMEYLADPAGAYMAMMANTAKGPPGTLPMTAVGYRHAKGGRIQRFDDGGGYVTDAASNQTVDSIDPSTTDATAAQGSSGISSQWLPLLTGAYSMSQGDPYAGAASIGVATQMMGGTPQDAMTAAKLLYKSGASQQPKAQQKSFDPNRQTTNSLLTALAQQAGAANQLRMAQLDPAGSMTTAPQPYQKPAVRGSTVLKATGGMVQGEHPDGILSDGHSYAVKGKGSGQSDDINAKLSNDEHVIDAGTVAALGDGSSDEGHRRLDQMREIIRKKAGLKNPKKIMGKQPGVSQILARVAGGRV